MTHRAPYKTLIFTTKPTDFHSRVEVSACYCEYDNKILLLHRASHKPQGGTWGVPAGKLEAGETALEAVIRETLEEVGIKLSSERLQDLGTIFVRYPHLDFTYHMFYQKFSNLPQVHLSEEHIAYQWTTFEEALVMPLISGGVEALHHFAILKSL